MKYALTAFILATLILSGCRRSTDAATIQPIILTEGASKVTTHFAVPMVPDLYFHLVEFNNCEWVVGGESSHTNVIHSPTCKFCAERAKAAK